MFDVDFIVVAHNQLDYTRRCVESIFRNVKISFHLILIDNNSNDGTALYLEEIRKRESNNSHVTIIRNDKNNGYAIGLNQGLEQSSSSHVLFCNNDIEFYPGAVEEMIRVANSKKEYGLINPNSNEFGLSGYDQAFIESQKERTIERCHTSGFCVLVKRDVINKIGGIDPAFSPAYFEDMDFAERAKKAGFLCVVAKGAYAHHYGTRTFLALEKQKLWDRNREIFNQKWGGTKWFIYHAQDKELANPIKRMRVLNSLLRIARTNIAIIYLFISKSSKCYFEDIHDSFRVITTPSLFRSIIVFLRIFRWFSKKPISKIYASTSRDYNRWKNLKIFHRAEVCLLLNEETASR